MNRAPVDVLVLGSSPTGLYALREAARSGLRVGLVDAARGCAFSSRYAAWGLRLDPAGLRHELGRLASQGPMPLLVPTSDCWIEAVIEGRAETPTLYRSFQCYDERAGQLLDKLQFHDLCKRHGMATPGLWRAEGREALAALADQLPFPCILKPALIHKARDFLRGQKVLLARSRDEYVAQVEAMPAGVGEWFVQEIIPGPESNITLFGGYIATGGEPRQVFTARKLRQYPAGFGSASLVSSEPCDETLATTLAFLAEVGFKGICGAEFKRDPRDGRLKMIEINPRPTLWFQAIHDAGCRVVEAAWRDAAGLEPLAPRAQRRNVRWRYLLKDASSARFYRRTPDFVFPPPDVAQAKPQGKRSWPVFSPADPLPALAEPLGFLRKFMDRRK